MTQKDMFSMFDYGIQLSDYRLSAPGKTNDAQLWTILNRSGAAMLSSPIMTQTDMFSMFDVLQF
jgi:hypothetical protein